MRQWVPGAATSTTCACWWLSSSSLCDYITTHRPTQHELSCGAPANDPQMLADVELLGRRQEAHLAACCPSISSSVRTMAPCSGTPSCSTVPSDAFRMRTASAAELAMYGGSEGRSRQSSRCVVSSMRRATSALCCASHASAAGFSCSASAQLCMCAHDSPQSRARHLLAASVYKYHTCSVCLSWPALMI